MATDSPTWPHEFLRLAGSLALAVLISVIGVCIYRITLHPLAKYPGPLLSKITDWSLVLQASSGDRHLSTWEEHNKYGSIVRIGPNALSFNTVTALKAIYSSRKSNVRKSDWYRTIDAGSKAFSLHSEIDKARHAFRRRVIDQAFSDSAVGRAEELVLNNVQTWVERLGPDGDKRGWSEARDMKDWCNWLSFDMMGDLTFGRGFGCVEKGQHRSVPEVVMEATKFIYVAGFWPFISLVRPLLGTRWASMLFTKDAAGSEAYITYANSMMEERMAAEKSASESDASESRKDFIHYLLHARDPETNQGLSIHELHADSALLIHAGSDTTALTLSAATFYLSHNPAVLSRLQSEIRRAFPSASSIRSGPALTELTYLRAVIDETLRLSPAVPSHLPREVMPGGIDIDDHHFAAGTVVGVAPWTIHHNPAYYPEPFTFNPDRWIASSSSASEDSVALARAAFCPFSIGPRGCAGKRIAYLEVSLALATLLWTYDVRLPTEGEGGGEVRGGVQRQTAMPSKATENRHNRAEASHAHAAVRDNADLYQLWDHFVADRQGPVVQFRNKTAEA